MAINCNKYLENGKVQGCKRGRVIALQSPVQMKMKLCKATNVAFLICRNWETKKLNTFKVGYLSQNKFPLCDN